MITVRWPCRRIARYSALGRTTQPFVEARRKARMLEARGSVARELISASSSPPVSLFGEIGCVYSIVACSQHPQANLYAARFHRCLDRLLLGFRRPRSNQGLGIGAGVLRVAGACTPCGVNASRSIELCLALAADQGSPGAWPQGIRGILFYTGHAAHDLLSRAPIHQLPLVGFEPFFTFTEAGASCILRVLHFEGRISVNASKCDDQRERH